MIVYALFCEDCEHAFEGWFAGSDAFDRLKASRQIDCPACSSRDISKQIMAPAVRPSDRARPQQMGPDAIAREIARRAREHVAENFDYVGDGFAEEARAMYYGEQDDRPIWGETTPDERAALADEGIPALPLPAPFAPKRPRRKDRLN